MSENSFAFTSRDALRDHLCATPFVTSAELRRLVPWGRTTFYRRIHSDGFPNPIGPADGGDYMWWSFEVTEYLMSLPEVLGEDRRQPAPESRDVGVAEVPIAVRSRKRNQPRRTERSSPATSLQSDGTGAVVTSTVSRRVAS